MPRGRPRKVGLRRQDAAMDAMRELGFEASRCCYGCHEKAVAGWIFIEEASYKLLIETLLEDADEGEKCYSSKDDHTVSTSCAPSDAHSPAATPPPALPPPTAAPPPNTASLPAAVSPPTAEQAAGNEKNLVHTPETLDPHPKKRRKRFHGWINESPEHLLDLRGLILPKKLEQVKNRIERRGKHKSRWDVKPEDM